MRRRFIALSAAALALSASCAGTPVSRAGDKPAAAARGPAPSMEQAEALFQAKKWEEAAQAFRRVTTTDPKNARAWSRLGAALHSAQRYQEAAAAWTRAAELGKDPIAMYNLACSLARSNKRKEAIGWLERSLDAGFPAAAGMASDPDLAGLKGEEGFEALLRKAEKLAKPCQFAPERRQFDFWVGEWDVFNPAGQKAGTNSVQSVEQGCVILENWTGSLGGSGKSMNFYDPGTKRWRQVWVDSRGGVSEFSGEFKDGAMRFSGQTRRPDGTIVERRLTFFHVGPDEVRQLSELSEDGGASWKVGYDFTYRRRK